MVLSWILAAGIIVLVLGSAYGIRSQVSKIYTFDSPTTPTIWWVVDDSQVNSRQWLDFQARSTRVPNEPYLQVCLKRAEKYLAGSLFTLEPIIGRVDAHARLEAAGCRIPPDADRAPPMLWLAWCRAAFATHLGGLWLDGSVLPVGTASTLYGRLFGNEVLTFGTDPDEGLSVAESTAPAAGPSAGWAARTHHPMWVGLERDFAALIDVGDQSWSAAECRRAFRYSWDRHCSGTTKIDRKAEVSRDKYGRRLELDTLLGETEWIYGTKEGALWVPLPDGRDKLERATPWLWFLRLSEEQIRESKFVWASWATSSPE
jgi:hypothetical protein